MRLSANCGYLALAVAALVGLSAGSTRAELIAYEGFDYPAGTLIDGQTGGTGFGAAWDEVPTAGDNRNSLPEAILGTGLTFSTLTTTGNRLSASDRDAYDYRPFASSYSSGSLFVSFLLRKDTFNGRADDYAGVSLTGTGDAELFVGDPSSDSGASDFYALENTGGGARIDSAVPVNDAANFLLVSIDFNASGANERIRLFVNPTLGGSNTFVQKFADLGTINGVAYLAGFGESTALRPNPTTSFDELRVGTTLADVTPVPEPAGLLLATLAAPLLLVRRRR